MSIETPKGHVAIVDAEAIHETEKALLIEIDGDQHWIAKSQIHEDSEVFKKGQSGRLVITEWIAKQVGIE